MLYLNIIQIQILLELKGIISVRGKYLPLFVSRECTADKCPSRKCAKYAFSVNGLFQFWHKQHHLCINVFFFSSILNKHRIQWVQLDRLKKALKCINTYIFITFRALLIRLPDRHLKFECNIFFDCPNWLGQSWCFILLVGLIRW